MTHPTLHSLVRDVNATQMSPRPRRALFGAALALVLSQSACQNDTDPGSAMNPLGVDSGASTGGNSTGSASTPPTPTTGATSSTPPAASSPSATASPTVAPTASVTPSVNSSATPSATSPAASTSAEPTTTAGAGGQPGAEGTSSQAGTSGELGEGGEGSNEAPPMNAGGSASEEAGAPPASGDFSPCPDDGPCRILPLGDSITEGMPDFNGGYRVPLFALAVGDGHEITFTGSRSNGPDEVAGQPFPIAHEGTSGITIGDLDSQTVPSPALDDDPNIILLHIGTNDMVQGGSGADARLGTIIDHLIEGAPDALLVVSNLIPLPFAADAIDAYNARVVEVVQERADAGKHILFVDQFTGFPENELADMVHPNVAGYERMADVWYAAISEYLK